MARAYRKILYSFYANDLWIDLRLHAKREAVEYIIAHMNEAMVLPDRLDLLKFALGRAPAEGLVLEFGVEKGASLRHLAGLTARQGPHAKCMGSTVSRGCRGIGAGPRRALARFRCAAGCRKCRPMPSCMSAGSTRPCRFFWRKMRSACALVHVDCDIYISTVTIFEQLRGRIVPGTVIVFDEYFNYPGWRAHEYKAFQEFIATSGLGYRYLGFSAEKGHVAVVIT